VGKSLELSKIEVIEDHEKQLYLFHQKKFKMIRDSELIATQRMEAKVVRN